MADLLPPEAAERRALCARVMRTFELAGYALVIPPVFEHAEVLERGNGGLENRDLLRFVEPESGEVAVLRPDITPQIARIVATQLAEHPLPIRLCYEGRVFRRQRGRARSHRQVSQAGVECIGLGEVEGDAEVLSLAIQACEAAGLREFRVELSDVRLVRSLLQAVPENARGEVSAAMARKDHAELASVARSHGVGADVVKQLDALVDGYGDADVLRRAHKRFTSAAAKAGLDGLTRIVARLEALGLDQRIAFDLGETRGLSYYTGMHFSVLAKGPGEALGGGGRYDSLLSRFGFDAPATGFALDLGHLQWTLRSCGTRRDGSEVGVRLAITGGDRRRIDALSAALRAEGCAVAALPERSERACLAFARAFGYDGVLRLSKGETRLLWLDGSSLLQSGSPQELARRMAATVNERRSARAKD
jgi:ATP phosphoribosyltransferase regulatory subunit